ncbi:hypothetical protein LCGC14_0641740 [marine sediment metagenome]|uniref:S-adenosylmethionine decarboxylase proenzyme n=1 Tax=marine sediment metagenome TaxID=412755 RepID=A0A0F9TKF1_9ZZZZ|nr:hypothetical protein [Candidatus Aminicenantes bacterium]
MYGKELILDLHNCNSELFTRETIDLYFKELCKLIDMTPERVYWWDDEGVPEEYKQTQAHTKGTTAIQFILTSNITIHTLDILKSVYVNIFSCKDFDSNQATDFTEIYFRGVVKKSLTIDRI